MTRTVLCHVPELMAYDLGDAHPMKPVVPLLAVDLARACGLLDQPQVEVVNPGPATVDEITRVHAPAYVQQVQRYSANPELAASWEAGQWGLGLAGDTPAVAGLHDAAAALCGVARGAALAVWEGRARQALALSGGLHHALRNRASGFSVYNDPAIAIQTLLDAGAERVAYVDVDAHHGDGVQWIFYDDPRVLTCSVHESGRHLFPGTGALEERGTGEATGTAINVPLPPFSGDGPYLRAVEEVFAPAVRAFRPDVLVVEIGWDGHHADPLTHLQLTLDGFLALFGLLSTLASDAAHGRTLVIGCGGYDTDLIPRAITLLLADMIGVEIDDQVPKEWIATARRLTGREPSALLRTDPGSTVPSAQRERADLEGDQVVDLARAMVT